MAQDFAKQFYSSKEWKRVRKQVLEESYYICARCHRPSKELIVHHKIKLTPLNINNPDITLNTDNLIPLCINCHNIIHGYEQERQCKFDSEGNLIGITDKSPR